MLSIQSKLSKICKQQQMVQKIYRNCKSCWISEMQTIQLKLLEILGAKLNGKKTSKKQICEKFWSTLWDCLLFQKFWKCCSVCYWKLQKIQTRCFAWMESTPSFYYSYNKPSSYGIRPWTPPSKKNMKLYVCWWVNAAFNFWKKYKCLSERVAASFQEYFLQWRFSVS